MENITILWHLRYNFLVLGRTSRCRSQPPLLESWRESFQRLRLTASYKMDQADVNTKIKANLRTHLTSVVHLRRMLNEGYIQLFKVRLHDRTQTPVNQCDRWKLQQSCQKHFCGDQKQQYHFRSRLYAKIAPHQDNSCASSSGHI